MASRLHLSRLSSGDRSRAANRSATNEGIEGFAVVGKKNPHLGSSFESWLDDEGIREESTAAAIKAVIALQLAAEMKKRRITKSEWPS